MTPILGDCKHKYMIGPLPAVQHASHHHEQITLGCRRCTAPLHRSCRGSPVVGATPQACVWAASAEALPASAYVDKAVGSQPANRWLKHGRWLGGAAR